MSAFDPGVGVWSGWERRRAADLPSPFPRAPLGCQLEAVAPAPQDRRLPKARGRPGSRGLGVGSAPAIPPPWACFSGRPGVWSTRSLLPPGLVKERAVFRLFVKYKPPSLIQQCLWGSCCVPGCAPLKPRSCRGRQGPCPLGPHASWGRQRNGTRPGSAQWRMGAGQRDGGWPVASLGG